MRHLARVLALAASFLTVVAAAAEADDALQTPPAIVLPATVMFATTTGYWRTDASDPTSVPPAGGSTTAAPAAQHGYYKLYAVRQPDHTSKVYLQQIAVGDDGLEVLSTVELTEITALKAFVTDIRPENSGGIIREPGLFASVILKTDPDGEPENWTVLIDELGEVTVEKAPG